MKKQVHLFFKALTFKDYRGAATAVAALAESGFTDLAVKLFKELDAELSPRRVDLVELRKEVYAKVFGG